MYHLVVINERHVRSNCSNQRTVCQSLFNHDDQGKMPKLMFFYLMFTSLRPLLSRGSKGYFSLGHTINIHWKALNPALTLGMFGIATVLNKSSELSFDEMTACMWMLPDPAVMAADIHSEYEWRWSHSETVRCCTVMRCGKCRIVKGHFWPHTWQKSVDELWTDEAGTERRLTILAQQQVFGTMEVDLPFRYNCNHTDGALTQYKLS